jgi:hypothetical protein
MMEAEGSIGLAVSWGQVVVDTASDMAAAVTAEAETVVVGSFGRTPHTSDHQLSPAL